MRVIVTGAGGFVGAALVRKLLDDGHRVVAVDLRLKAPPSPSMLTRIEGDIGNPDVAARAFDHGCDAVVHLATVPGGAAEADPQLARRVNIDAALELIALSSRRTSSVAPRFVFASSIAVFGDNLPADGVDDRTPVAPSLVYGAHKAMMEIAVATATRRGEIDGLSLRLPAVLARPLGPSGMNSAFMSELFHAIAAGEAFLCPVSPSATIWAQSLQTCVANLAAALGANPTHLPADRAVTLPALRIRLDALAEEVARQTNRHTSLVSYAPNAALERAFGAQPPLSTPTALAAGFCDDGVVVDLVRRTLADMAVPLG